MNQSHFRFIIAIVMLCAFTFCLPSGVYAADCSDFPDGGTLTGVINTYYTGIDIHNAGATRIRVVHNSGIRGASTTPDIAAGDMLLIIQMQDADINSDNTSSYGDGTASNPANSQTALNSAGYYEYVVALGPVVTTGNPGGRGYIDISGAGTGNGLLHTYRTVDSDGGANPDTPRRSFQVIRVPRYKTATLSSGLTAEYWNGDNGGVLALDITGALTLGGTVSVDGMGFRGGAGRQLNGDTGANTDYRNRATYDSHASKGEGIVGTPYWVLGYTGSGFANINTFGTSTDSRNIGYPADNTGRDASHCKGAPGNAGGGGNDDNPSANDENSGGGGGGNGGQGGYGGYNWSPTYPGGVNTTVRGNPGAAVVADSNWTIPERITMGGGGGAGTRNNSPSIAYASAGGPGGGIAIIRATAVTGTGTITANGRGRDISGITPENDGGGGGGAGGSIIVVTRNGSLGGLTVQANGGNGVDGDPDGVRHGPGGGGGGGVILLSSTASSASVTGGANGTTTAASDPYGATPGNAGVVDSTISMGDLPGVESCDSTLASRATIRGLRIDRAGQVRFVTDSQYNTAAFQLWQTDDPKNPADMDLLTKEPVVSQDLFSMKPLVYKVQTFPITKSYIFIEEIEANGMHNMMGPFPVKGKLLTEEFDRVETELFERESRRIVFAEKIKSRVSRFVKFLKSRTNAIKIEVAAAEKVQLDGAELIEMGVPERLLQLKNKKWREKLLNLTHLGQAVPYEFYPDQGNSGLLEFSASAFSTDYTNRSVYVLSWAAGKWTNGLPEIDFTRSGFPLIAGMTRIEQNSFYAGFVAEGADPWIWTFISAGTPQVIRFDAGNIAAIAVDEVPVSIGVTSATDHAHIVGAYLNDHYIGEISFNGLGLGQVKGQVPAEAIDAYDNELRVVYSVADAEKNPYGLIFLDVIDLGINLEPSEDIAEIVRLDTFDASLPFLRGVDYLILTHPLFAEGAQQIADQKQREGFRAAVVDIERVYDHYSCGVVEAEAIRQFLRDVWRLGGKRLKYLLLIGDDTFDPNNYLGLDQTCFIPSLTTMDQEFGRIPSENLYADMNDDGIPEIAIGRLPVSSEQQMMVVAEKIIHQDVLLSAGRDEHLFAVDNQGVNDPSFRAMAETIAATLPEKKNMTWADVGQGATTANETLLGAFSSGVEAVHYFGHGGFNMWSDDGLLSVSQIDEVENSGAGAVVFTWTCNVQYFRHHLGPAINEALFLVPDGGAVAAVGPVGVTKPKIQEKLYFLLYENLRSGMSLGQALQQAKVDAVKMDEAARSAAEGWTLLGDPSLLLNWQDKSSLRMRGR